METIKCEICEKDRPQIELVPVSFTAGNEDEYYVVCIHCLEAGFNEREMIFPEQLVDLAGRW